MVHHPRSEFAGDLSGLVVAMATALTSLHGEGSACEGRYYGRYDQSSWLLGNSEGDVRPANLKVADIQKVRLSKMSSVLCPSEEQTGSHAEGNLVLCAKKRAEGNLWWLGRAQSTLVRNLTWTIAKSSLRSRTRVQCSQWGISKRKT